MSEQTLQIFDNHFNAKHNSTLTTCRSFKTLNLFPIYTILQLRHSKIHSKVTHSNLPIEKKLLQQLEPATPTLKKKKIFILLFFHISKKHDSLLCDPALSSFIEFEINSWFWNFFSFMNNNGWCVHKLNHFNWNQNETRK